MLLTSQDVSYHSSHAYNAGTQRSQSLWTLFRLYTYNNIVIFWNTWSKTVNGWIWSVERVNSLTNDTLVRRAFITRHRCMSQQSQKHSTSDTTPHPIGRALASGIVPSFASLVSVYGFLLVLILGSEYGIMTMIKRDGWHTWEPTLLDEISIACASQVSMNVSIKISGVVRPLIELLFRVQTGLDQWFSRELIRNECICARLTFAAQLIWVRCSAKLGIVGTKINSQSEVRCFCRC